MFIDETKDITASVQPIGAKVTWMTSDESIIALSNTNEQNRINIIAKNIFIMFFSFS